MDWLLAALAIFNLVSMATVFSLRAIPRRSVPWALFGTALLRHGAAWIWLPLQLAVALALVSAGALETGWALSRCWYCSAPGPGLV